MPEFNLKSFISEDVFSMGFRRDKASQENHMAILNKNELPYDIDEKLKNQICKELKSSNWNLYPDPYNYKLEERISKIIGVKSENILLSSGAGSLITMLFNFFSDKEFIIPEPSFSLFEYHCKTHGLNYKKWPLNNNFQFDLNLFPILDEPAIIVIDSPNNPTGSTINKKDLTSLLNRYQDSLFLIDEVYTDFDNHNHLDLLKKYNNLILLRSFSKAYSLAGIRLGYIVAQKDLILNLRKVLLTFSVGIHAQITLNVLLNNTNWLNKIKSNINEINSQKNWVYNQLLPHSIRLKYKALQSHANFLLLLFDKLEHSTQFNENMISNGILVLQLPQQINGKYLIRISIGSKQENELLINTIESMTDLI